MLTKENYKQSQLIRKHKVCTGAVIWGWIPPAFFNMDISLV